jgi:hypothetical protein
MKNIFIYFTLLVGFIFMNSSHAIGSTYIDPAYFNFKFSTEISDARSPQECSRHAINNGYTYFTIYRSHLGNCSWVGQKCYACHVGMNPPLPKHLPNIENLYAW